MGNAFARGSCRPSALTHMAIRSAVASSGAGQKDPVSPQHGRRMADARQLDAPVVVGLGPGGRNVGRVAHAGAVRAAEPRPFLRRGDGSPTPTGKRRRTSAGGTARNRQPTGDMVEASYLRFLVSRVSCQGGRWGGPGRGAIRVNPNRYFAARPAIRGLRGGEGGEAAYFAGRGVIASSASACADRFQPSAGRATISASSPPAGSCCVRAKKWTAQQPSTMAIPRRSSDASLRWNLHDTIKREIECE